jgi:hypothetical protein
VSFGPHQLHLSQPVGAAQVADEAFHLVVGNRHRFHRDRRVHVRGRLSGRGGLDGQAQEGHPLAGGLGQLD